MKTRIAFLMVSLMECSLAFASEVCVAKKAFYTRGYGTVKQFRVACIHQKGFSTDRRANPILVPIHLNRDQKIMADLSAVMAGMKLKRVGQLPQGHMVMSSRSRLGLFSDTYVYAQKNAQNTHCLLLRGNEQQIGIQNAGKVFDAYLTCTDASQAESFFGVGETELQSHLMARGYRFLGNVDPQSSIFLK